MDHRVSHVNISVVVRMLGNSSCVFLDHFLVLKKWKSLAVHGGLLCITAVLAQQERKILQA